MLCSSLSLGRSQSLIVISQVSQESFVFVSNVNRCYAACRSLPSCELTPESNTLSVWAGEASVLPVSNSAYLLQTFISRFRRIMDSSQNAYNEDTSALVARLDELERALFQAGQKELNDFQSWEKGQASQITASSLVQNYGKRKFTEVDDWKPEEGAATVRNTKRFTVSLSQKIKINQLWGRTRSLSISGNSSL